MLWILMKTKQSSQALSLSVDGLQCRLQKKQELAKLACLLESVISQSGLPCLSYEALCNSCQMFLVQTHLFRYNLCTRTTHISASESLAPQGLVLPQGRAVICSWKQFENATILYFFNLEYSRGLLKLKAVSNLREISKTDSFLSDRSRMSI